MPNCKKTFPENALQAQPEISVPWMQPLRILSGVALIILAAFFVYFPSLSGGFIFDDDLLLTNNPLVKSSAGLYQFWSAIEQQVYPVSNSTLWIEWRLWGMKPTGYHITNLILHIVESLLIWVILRKLSIPGAFLAALIFAVHPVNVESVAWIAQRKGLMAMLFFLLSILCYLKFEIPSSLSSHHSPPSSVYSPPSTVHRPLFYWLSLLAFVLAMLSKGTMAILPLLLLGILWWQRTGTVPIFASAKMGLSPSVSRRDLLRTVPFFLVALLLTGVNVWFQSYQFENAIRNVTFMERLLGAGGVVWFYLYKALLPLNLVFVYPEWHVRAENLLWWLPLLAAGVITAVLWRYRAGWSRPFLFAWGFFCVALVPVLGFADVCYMQFSLVADHYQHLALVGVIALAAAGWGLWRQRPGKQARAAANATAVVVVGALTFLTWQQSGLYRNAITLYQATLKKNPDCCMVHNNLGTVLDDAGRPQEAINHYEQALRLKPNYPEAHNNLGVVLANAGRFQEAIDHYGRALKLKPKYAEAHNNLGNALGKIGRPQEAIEHFQQSLKFKPNFVEARFNLGNTLAGTGRPQEAIKHYEQALRLKPDYAEAHNNLAAALSSMGLYPQAIEHSRQALRLRPDYAKAWANLAALYARTNRSAEALAAAHKAIELALSQGQTALARQIEDWLNAYRAQNTVK